MSLIDSKVAMARAANATAIAFAKRGLRAAARRWFESAKRELHVARMIRGVK